MEEVLISKKEVLETYKISYGALYRWKRLGLIPEEWFIKKATVTGQETFFPEKLIRERIELIKEQKDDVSLKDLSRALSKESERTRSLIVGTAYGQRTFSIGDIKSIIIDNGDGTSLDITKDIIGGDK